jgi:ubiquinone/menaquinone biosynthesis C-methylase UbiE
MGRARYDGLAEWFDREFATGARAVWPLEALTRLLGEGEGRLLDVGCGTGSFSAALARLGWRITGLDISEDQLRLARERGVDVVRGDAADLPFDDRSFDAAVSTWTHTDVDDVGAVLAELARVLRPGATFVYIGAHPCFVGPHSRFVGAQGVPELHPGYRSTGRYFQGPAISAEGLRAKVGATHLPLSSFLQAFLDAGFSLERIEEDAQGEYPHLLALRLRR